MLKVCGLTGGIASGKTTVAKLFRELGIPVVDADQVSRDVVLPGSPGLQEIVETFGDVVLQEDGSLDRKKLGEVIFGDEAKRQKLNSILHPKIGLRSFELLQAELAKSAPYAIYEAALLVETGGHRLWPKLIVVAASIDVQRERLMKRDGLSEEEAEARIASQDPIEKKTEVADFVIWNHGSEEELREEVQKIDAQLRTGF